MPGLTKDQHLGAGVRVGATPACGTLSQTSVRGTHKDKLKETVSQAFSDNGSSRKEVTRDCESAVTGCLQPGHAPEPSVLMAVLNPLSRRVETGHSANEALETWQGSQINFV